MHVEEDPRHVRTALAQLEAMLDESVWPDWIDQAHLRFRVSRGSAHRNALAGTSRSRLTGCIHFFPTWSVHGFWKDSCAGAFAPILRVWTRDPWWSHDLNNWYTVIIGGLGIAGMALGDAHPLARRLFDLSFERMQRYLSIYGGGGEFNESIAYSNATRLPVAYFSGLRRSHPRPGQPTGGAAVFRKSGSGLSI